MSEVEPILDFIILKVPTHVDVGDPDQQVQMEMRAQYQVMNQYQHKPKAVLLDPIEWLVTSDWHDVEDFQPAHQCPTCLAANDQAIAFLKEHPDERLALGNLRYREIW